MSARTRRSSSGTARDSWRLLAPQVPHSKAPRSARSEGRTRAIERVRIDRSTLEPRYKVIGSELWSDEGGFTEDIAVSGVTGICGSGIIEVVAELFLAGGDHRGRQDRRIGRRAVVANSRRRTNVRLRDEGRWSEDSHHAARCPRDPACEGCALRGRVASHGPSRGRCRRPDTARRRIRKPHRRPVRDGPRPHPRLRPGAGHLRRQRRGNRCDDRPARPKGSQRDRESGQQRREDRDCDGAELPGPLRGCDGAPAQDSGVSQPHEGDGAARAQPDRHRAASRQKGQTAVRAQSSQ